jgi:transposase-like protein
MRPSDFGGTGLARCSRHRSERSGLRICAASPGGWHLDEVFVKINGTLCYLWRAVDHEGEVLETVVTAKRIRWQCSSF